MQNKYNPLLTFWETIRRSILFKHKKICAAQFLPYTGSSPVGFGWGQKGENLFAIQTPATSKHWTEPCQGHLDGQGQRCTIDDTASVSVNGFPQQFPVDIKEKKEELCGTQ